MTSIRNKMYKENLQIYTVDELKRIAKLAGLINLPTRKMDIIGELAAIPFESAFSRMNDVEKLALATAVYDTHGELNVSQFSAQHGALPYKYHENWGGRETSILDLYIIHERVCIGLVGELKKLLPPPPPNKISVLDNPDVYLEFYDKEDFIVQDTEKSTWKNIKATLQLVSSGKISISKKTGIPSSASVKLINEHLDKNYHEFYIMQAFALPLLLNCAGYVTLSGSKLILTAKGKKVLSGEIAQQDAVSHLWECWSKKGSFDELSRIDIIKGQKRAGTLTPPKNRRATINETLKNLPAYKWIDIEELGRYMRASGYYFEVARNRWNLYFYDSNYGSLGYDGYGGWDILQERYIKTLFLEYYATLGLIDVIETAPEDTICDWRNIWGLDDEPFISIYDGLLAFRINSLGAYVFGIEDSYEAVEEKIPAIFEILPNNDIVVPHIHKLQSFDKLYLDKFSKQSSDVTWQISIKSILDAIESGESIDEIKDFLSSRTHRQLPQTIETLFYECQKRIVSLNNKGQATLIECKDEEFIIKIKHDPRMKKICTVAEQFIVIHPSKEKQFFNRINSMGHAVFQKGMFISQ